LETFLVIRPDPTDEHSGAVTEDDFKCLLRDVGRVGLTSQRVAFTP
jgi:hypothetical protein